MTDICENNHRGNLESVSAYEAIRNRSFIDRLRILEYAAWNGAHGITCEEAERALGISHQSCSARCSELKRDGKLRPSELTRKTQSGRAARVLVAA